MRGRTFRAVIEAIVGAGDSDSVTRRIRRSLANHQTRPSSPQRGVIGELVNFVSGRGSAHSTIRHLALRRTRS